MGHYYLQGQVSEDIHVLADYCELHVVHGHSSLHHTCMYMYYYIISHCQGVDMQNQYSLKSAMHKVSPVTS